MQSSKTRETRGGKIPFLDHEEEKQLASECKESGGLMGSTWEVAFLGQMNREQPGSQ